MENKVKLLIEIGLQRDEERGDVSVVAFDVPVGVAERVCEEQEKCALLSESGELTKLLNAYAVINGYQCAWFIFARCAESSESRVQSAELMERLMNSFMHCRHSDTDDNACDGCPYEEVKYCASEQARDSLTLFALWKTELEGMIKDVMLTSLQGSFLK